MRYLILLLLLSACASEPVDYYPYHFNMVWDVDYSSGVPVYSYGTMVDPHCASYHIAQISDKPVMTEEETRVATEVVYYTCIDPSGGYSNVGSNVLQMMYTPTVRVQIW
jgi:hypothetical protein